MSNNPRESEEARQKASVAPGSAAAISGALDPEGLTTGAVEGGEGIEGDSAATLPVAPSPSSIGSSGPLDPPSASGKLSSKRFSKKIKMADPDADKAKGRKRKSVDADKTRILGAAGSPDASGSLEDVEAHAEERDRKRRRKRRNKIIRRTLLAILGVLILGALAAFALFRWSVYDDAQDLKGAWELHDQGNTITITDDKIVLTDDVAYDYVVDPDTKTLYFTFGNLNGTAHYRFSLDRKELAIGDGERGWLESTGEDAAWLIRALAAQVAEGTALSPANHEKGELVFSKVEE